MKQDDPKSIIFIVDPVFDVKSVQVPVIGGRRRIFSKKEERRRVQLPIAVTLSAPHPLRPPLPAITDSL